MDKMYIFLAIVSIAALFIIAGCKPPTTGTLGVDISHASNACIVVVPSGDSHTPCQLDASKARVSVSYVLDPGVYNVYSTCTSTLEFTDLQVQAMGLSVIAGQRTPVIIDCSSVS